MSKIVEETYISSDMKVFEMEIDNIESGLSFDERIQLQRDLEERDSISKERDNYECMGVKSLIDLPI